MICITLIINEVEHLFLSESFVCFSVVVGLFLLNF